MRVITKRKAEDEIPIPEPLTEKEIQQDPELKGPYCVCRGVDDGTPMICCDKCNEWYHIRCIQMTIKTARVLARVGSKYYCDKCQPPAEQQQIPNKKHNTRSATANANGASDSSSDSDSSSSSSDSSDDESHKNRVIKKPQPNKEIHKAKKARTEVKGSKDTADMQKRLKVIQSLTEVLNLEEGNYDRMPIAAEIENKLFNAYPDFQTYKSKLITLLFNLKDPKNTELRRGVLTRDLPADTLVKMSSTDLANKDLAAFRRARDEKFLDGVVLKEEPIKPVNLKGIENMPHEDHDAQLAMQLQAPVITKNTEKETTVNNSLPDIEVRSPIAEPVATTYIKYDPATDTVNHKTTDNDIQIINEPMDVPSFDEFAGDDDLQPVESTRPTKQKGKKNKDGTWPVLIKTSAPSKFKVKASFVSGDRYYLEKHFPDRLEQVGRMDMDKLASYLPQVMHSSSRKLSLVSFETDSDEDNFEYVAAFELFRSSGKAAVVKALHFKECFLVPISGDASVPGWADAYVSGGKDRIIGAFVSNKSKDEIKKGKKDKKAKSKGTESIPSPKSPTTPPTPPQIDSTNKNHSNMGFAPNVPQRPVAPNIIPPNMAAPAFSAYGRPPQGMQPQMGAQMPIPLTTSLFSTGFPLMHTNQGAPMYPNPLAAFGGMPPVTGAPPNNLTAQSLVMQLQQLSNVLQQQQAPLFNPMAQHNKQPPSNAWKK